MSMDLLVLSACRFRCTWRRRRFHKLRRFPGFSTDELHLTLCALRVLCASSGVLLQLFAVMAPSQSMMTKFLYDGRLHCEDSEFVNSNSCAQVLSNNHAGSGAPALSDGNGDPVLLGASDVPEGVKAVAASDATPEVVILDPSRRLQHTIWLGPSG